MTEIDTPPLCGIDDCEEIARYVETGDGSAHPDPRFRCHGHKPEGGLWRDMKTALYSEYARYDNTDAGERGVSPVIGVILMIIITIIMTWAIASVMFP